MTSQDGNRLRKASESGWGKFGVVVAALGLLVAILAYANDINIWPSGPGSTSPTSLVAPAIPAARGAYIAQVDTLCQTAEYKIEQIGDLPSTDNASSIRWIKATNPVLSDLYSQWTAVPYPDEDEGKVRAILEPFKVLNAHLGWVVIALQNEGNATTQAQYDEFRRTENVEWNAVHEAALAMGTASDSYGLANCSKLVQFP